MFGSVTHCTHRNIGLLTQWLKIKNPRRKGLKDIYSLPDSKKTQSINSRFFLLYKAESWGSHWTHIIIQNCEMLPLKR